MNACSSWESGVLEEADSEVDMYTRRITSHESVFTVATEKYLENTVDYRWTGFDYYMHLVDHALTAAD